MANANPVVDLTPYQFRPGQSGNPAGRPRGARAKLSELTLNKLLADFELHGDAVIEDVRKKQPSIYLQCVVSLLPKQAEKVQPPLTDLTDDELEKLEHWLAASRAKQIEQLPAGIDATADEIMRADDIAKGRISATEAHINARNAKDVTPT
jgi:hypothetical protein